MPDRYAVIGHPIAHSKSPQIHAEFARQTGQNLSYEAILAPLDGFAAAVAEFRAAGGAGGNVTVPFKHEAFALADVKSAAVELAGAANTLRFTEDGRILADNTDGAGLVADLTRNAGVALAGCDLLTIGQYLQPTPGQLEVVEHVHPVVFDWLRHVALSLGFRCVASAPLVRSSYHAEEIWLEKGAVYVHELAGVPA